MDENKRKIIFFAVFTLVIVGMLAYVIMGNSKPEEEHVNEEELVIDNDELVSEIDKKQGSQVDEVLSLDQRLNQYSSADVEYVEEDLFLKEPVDEGLEIEEQEPQIEQQPKTPQQKTVYVYHSTPQSKAVSPIIEKEPVQVRKKRRHGNSYYGGTQYTESTASDKFLHAVIHGEHKVRNGSKVKLRTTQKKIVENTIIPVGTFLYGIVSLSNERVNINVNSVAVQGKVINHKFKIYDTDGIEGIYIPGGINQEIAKGAVDDGLGIGSGVTVNVPLVGSISSDALKKKAKDPVVTLPTNYNVLINEK